MTQTHPTGRRLLQVALSCSAAFCCGSSLAEVSVPSVFSDHMVLQRDLPIPVWGTATPGEAVSVTFGNQTRSATTSADGTWRVDLDPMPASKRSRSLEIAGENSISITDVLVGEVWICGGQSNMDMALGSCDVPDEIASAHHPKLRHFRTGMNFATHPDKDLSGYQKQLKDYLEKKKALVSEWRELRKSPKLPFYFVQLAAWQAPNPNPEGGEWGHDPRSPAVPFSRE